MRNRVNSFITAYAGWLIRFKYPVVFISLAIVVALSYQAKNVFVQSDYKYFYAKHDINLKTYNDLEQTFTRVDSTIFVIRPNKESIASPRILKLVHDVTEKLWLMPHTSRVDSITNYQYTRADDEGIIVGDLLEDPDQLDEQKAKELVDIAMSRPELRIRLVSTETNAVAIIVRANLDPGDNQALSEAAEYAYDLRDEILKENPDLRIALGGLVVRGYQFGKVPVDDIKTLMPIMLGLLIVMMWLLTRSIASPLIMVFLVFLSSGSAVGLGALFGIPISTLSSSAPIIILTIAIADSIHIIVSYLTEYRKSDSRDESIIHSIQINASPVFLTSLTTCIGFLSLNFSDSPPLKDLGNFSALGTIVAFFLSMTYLPAIIAIIHIKPNQWIDKQAKGIVGVGEFILSHRQKLFWIVIAATMASLLLLPRLEFNDDFQAYFDDNFIDTDIDGRFIQEVVAGGYVYHLKLDAVRGSSVSDPEYLENVEKLTIWLRSLPEVKSVYSFTDIVKNINRSMNRDEEAFYRIPDNKELIAQYLLLYELSLPYGLDLNDQINIERTATRLDFTTVAMLNNESIEFTNKVNDWINDNLPLHMQTRSTAIHLLYAMLGIQNFESMQFSTTIAFILIGLSIGLSLRSIRLGLVSIVPNTVPIIVAFGLFALTGKHLAVWTPLVIPTVLGLIVDATVHFLSKYKYAVTTRGLSPEDSIRYAFSTVGMALWVSTLVLIIGFAVLYFSTIITLKYLGIMTALIISLALVIDFMVLPALLIATDRQKTV